MNYKVIFDDLISECFAMSEHTLDGEEGDLCILRNRLKDYLGQLLDDPANKDIFFFLIADIMQYQILCACNRGES